MISPVLRSLAEYPFARLNAAIADAEGRGIDVIDFGMGDPREPTPEFVRRALVESVPDRSGYPLASGLPEHRAAIAGWIGRRFGVELDPSREVIPTLGSKEAIYLLAQMVVAPQRRIVAVPEPAYPVYERGALFAGAEVATLPLREADGFLPRLDEIPPGTAIVWVNYPNNPTGALAPLGFYEELATLARERGFVLASDEAYTELWFTEPPASALQVADRGNVLVFNTLSKRSSMTGYRCGFAAGDPQLVEAMKAFRPTVGVAPQEFVQRAAIAAWSDESHVDETRERYRAKRDILLGVFARKRVRVVASEATMYLWIAVDEPSEQFATRLLEHGVAVAPGVYFGAAGEGYARLALVPTLDDCHRAAAILEEVL